MSWQRRFGTPQGKTRWDSYPHHSITPINIVKNTSIHHMLNDYTIRKKTYTNTLIQDNSEYTRRQHFSFKY